MDKINKFIADTNKLVLASSVNPLNSRNSSITRGFRAEAEAVALFSEAVRRYCTTLLTIALRIQDIRKYEIKIQQELNQETDYFLEIASLFEQQIPPQSRESLRALFRRLIGEYLFQSVLFKRFYEKPRGYPGDYYMFEMMYNNKPLSHGIGCYFDYYVFSHYLVRSVINRKNKMRNLLLSAISCSGGKAPCRILNIACGPSREVRDVVSRKFVNKKIEFTLLDQDVEGIRYSREKLAMAPDCVKIKFRQENILKLLGFSGRDPSSRANNYNVVYSLGLVDYFRDSVLERFVGFCLSLLRPGGQLIVAICSTNNIGCYTALRWLCEWNFYMRDPKVTVRMLTKKNVFSKIRLEWEKNEQIFFIVITK